VSLTGEKPRNVGGCSKTEMHPFAGAAKRQPQLLLTHFLTEVILTHDSSSVLAPGKGRNRE